MMKCFNFKAEAMVKIKGYVYANTIEEALDQLKDNQYDDYDFVDLIEITDIKNIEEDD